MALVNIGFVLFRDLTQLDFNDRREDDTLTPERVPYLSTSLAALH